MFDTYWREVYERTEIRFAIQAEIAQAVATQLRLELFVVDETRKLTVRDMANLEAYKYYLRWRQKYQTEQRDFIYTGAEELEKTIELDPDFADVYGLLAYLKILHSTVELYWKISPTIRVSFHRALTLNPVQPEALMTEAIDTGRQTWD